MQPLEAQLLTLNPFANPSAVTGAPANNVANDESSSLSQGPTNSFANDRRTNEEDVDDFQRMLSSNTGGSRPSQPVGVALNL